MTMQPFEVSYLSIGKQGKKERKNKNSIGKTQIKRRIHYEDSIYKPIKGGYEYTVEELRCPSSVQYFEREVGLHPTQKPVALFEYCLTPSH